MSDLKASNGGTAETDSEAGPGAYPAGGFELGTDLLRVDDATVSSDAVGYDARVDSITGNNTLVVVVVDAGSGAEVAADTDLSGVTFTYNASRR